MTIGAQNRNDAVGNGTTATYPYGFKIFAATDLEVTVRNTATDEETTLTYPTHYSVTGVGVRTGGNVVLVNSAAFAWIDGSGFLETGYEIAIRRKVDIVQETDIRNQGKAFAPSVHEDQFDYLTMIDQQQQDEIDRSLRVGPSFADIDTLLPAPVAGSVLGWADNELSIVNKLLAGSLSVSAYGQTLLNAATAAAARTLLDVPSTTEAILDTIFDAKGDLLVATAADTPARKAVGADGDTLLPSSAAGDGLAWVGPGAHFFNGTFTVAHNTPANGITIALKTDGGADPSDADPVFVAIPNGTGGYNLRKINAAMSLAVSAGSTLGTIANVTHRIYFGLGDDAGTLRLFAYNPYSYTEGPPEIHSLLGINDGQQYSSTAEGGAGAADSAQVLYSGTAFATKRVRVMGYWEGTQTVAGTWTAAPTYVHVLKPGDRRTGDIVQDVTKEYTAVATGSTVIPLDDTIPQNTEGDQYMNLDVTPTSFCNLVEVSVLGNFANSSTEANMAMALFRDSIANALTAVFWSRGGAANKVGQAVLSWRERSPQAGVGVSYKTRAGALVTAGTTTFNGDSSARRFGGTMNSHMRYKEIFA